jgi:hypothetical protein
MQYFAFYVSAILGLFKIAGFLFHRSQLHVVVTRDAFFRLIDSGEALFCSANLLARNGPVLITSVIPTLKRIDGPQKSFDLEILQFGEKVKGQGFLAEHLFYSSSPVAHIPEAIPQRTVYLCVQGEYKDQIRQRVEDFQKEILTFKQEKQKAGDQLSAALLVQIVQKAIDQCASKLMTAVQIEPGRYELTLRIRYEDPGNRMFSWSRTAESTINFQVKSDVKDFLWTNIKQSLQVSAQNLLFEQNNPIVYPTYQPSAIREGSFSRKRA